MGRHGPADADALLLAAGEGGRVGILFLGEADVLEDAQGSGTSLRLRLFPDGDQPLGDVVQRRLVGEQGVVLEHERGAFAQFDGLLVAGLGQIHGEVIDDEPPCIRGFQQVEAAQQSRLAGTGGADDDDNLPLLYLKIDAVEHLISVIGLGETR